MPLRPFGAMTEEGVREGTLTAFQRLGGSQQWRP